MTSAAAHQQPIVSVDTIPVYLDERGRLTVRLTRRAWEPFKDALALPGVMLSPNERLTEAATRALTTKASLAEDQVLAHRQGTVFDDFDRDPRGPTLAIPYLSVIAPDADAPDDCIDARPNTLPDLAFDHARIIADALDHLAASLLDDVDLSRALLGPEFAGNTLAGLYADIVDFTGTASRAPKNVARALRSSASTEDTGRTTPSRHGRPSPIWTWKA